MMSHFAVYAPTRNVGIDIVPLLSRPSFAARDCSPGIPGAIFLSPPPPPPLSRISDFAKFLQAGRVIVPPSSARVSRRNAKRVFYFGNGYILGSRLRWTRVERDRTSSFISDSYDFNHYFSTIRRTTNATTNAIRVK